MKRYLIVTTVGDLVLLESKELSESIKCYLDDYVDYVNKLDDEIFAICSNNLTTKQMVSLANSTIQYDDGRIAEIYSVNEKIY